jgi:putative addiction module CopG family antidote
VSVALDAQLEAMILKKVEIGLYPDTDEVIRQALRLPDEHDRVQQLRAKLQAGIEQLDRGEGKELTPELFAQIKQNAARKDREGHQPNPDVFP